MTNIPIARRLSQLLRPSAAGGALALVLGLDAGAAIRYVKPGGAGSQNGRTWGNAFANPQQALAVAGAGDQIWVAAGTYKPGGSQTDAFVLDIDDLKMFGGFAGTETTLPQRNPLVNLTYLSGDIDNDGNLDADNSHHVVRIEYASEEVTFETRLDVFVITMGYADGTLIDDRGGGLLVDRASPVVQNCVFIKNHAELTGAGAHVAGHPQFVNPQPPDAAPTFRACRFLGNECDDDGGGAGVTNGHPGFVNCVFSGNDCNSDGGGLWVQNDTAGPVSDVFIINCTFANNTVGGSGRSIYNGEEITLRNSICWSTSGSGAHVAAAGGASSTTSNNNIEGDSGTLNSNPAYVLALGHDSTVGTLDDNLRLSCFSPSIDEGDQNDVPADTYDVNDDSDFTEETPTADRRTRVQQVEVDQGAYETIADDCPADLDDSGCVDSDDMNLVILNWGACTSFPCPGDATSCAEGGSVDSDDMSAVILAWGPCPGQSCPESGVPSEYTDCMTLCGDPSAEGWIECIRACLCELTNGAFEWCNQ